MPTILSKPVTRVTGKYVGKHPIVITMAPLGSQSEALIGLRLLGRRTQYLLALSDLWRIGALLYGQREAQARRAARRAGIPWRKAKKDFIRDNTIDGRCAVAKISKGDK